MNRRGFLRSLLGASAFVAGGTVLGGWQLLNRAPTPAVAPLGETAALTMNTTPVPGLLVGRDYYVIEWPVATREWTFGTYCHEILASREAYSEVMYK